MPDQQQQFIERIQAHRGIIQKMLFLYVDDPTDRADVRQEILLQAWKSYAHFREDAKFSTWLYRISLNTVLTFLKRRRVATVDLPVHLNSRIDQPSTNLEVEDLLRVIRRLKEIDRFIITMHLDGYDNEEIAETLGLSNGNIRVRLHRIKKNLQKQLSYG